MSNSQKSIRLFVVIFIYVLFTLPFSAVGQSIVTANADPQVEEAAGVKPEEDTTTTDEMFGPVWESELITAMTYPFTFAGSVALEDMSSGTTQLVGPSLDDGVSPVTNIGFEFFFDGVRRTQFSVNGNGLMRLGATVVGSTFTNDLDSATNTPQIAAYWDDLCTNANGKVHSKLVGTAPNRTLVVEWQNVGMRVSPGLCVTPTGSFTFQVQLSETTGVVQFVYGAIPVTTLSYSVGFGTSTTAKVSLTVDPVTPTAAYGGTANDLNTSLINAGTEYTFTPNVPAAPTGLTTSSTATTVTLNWTDNATNEVGYPIYRSLDGVTYTFLAQAAADATSFTDTNLLPSTNYFYRVFAVTEGVLSSPALAGSQATTAVGNDVCLGAGGNWSSPATWADGSVPTASDNVAIGAACTVVVDIVDAAALNVTITGGTLQSPAAGTVVTNNLTVGGAVVNNGVLDFSTNADTSGASLTFGGSSFDGGLSGIGTVTDVRDIVVNKGVPARIVEVTTLNFTVRGVDTDVAGYLTLTSGTFKISGAFTLNNRTFLIAGYTIPATAAFWLNNANYTIAGQNGSPSSTGLLRLSQGTYNIGTMPGNTLAPGTGSAVTIEGGAMNITGRLQSISTAITYTQSGGNVNVCTIAQTATTACFGLTSATNIFNMTGGNITLVTPSGATTPLDYSVSTTSTFVANPAGTTLNVGTGAAVETFRVTGNTPNINIPANKTMNAGSGTAGAAIFFRGSTFTNNGAVGTQGTSSRFDFAAAGPMSYGGTGTFGTLAAPFGGVGVSSNSLSLITLNSPIITTRVNLFTGGFINSGQITLGNAGASTTVVQIGSAGLLTPGGSFDVSPVHNQGTGGQIILYAAESTPRTTGVEVNPTRILNFVSLSNPNPVTIAGGDLTLTSVLATASSALQLSVTRFITGANTLIMPDPASGVTRTTGYVDGNFRKAFAAAANKTFEVGTENGYSPVAVNVTAGAFPADFTVKAVQGPQPNIPVPGLALQRYWTLTEDEAITADLTFTYLDPTDIPATATEANFVIQKFAGGIFTQPGGTVDTTANTANIMGVTDFSDWTLAEPGGLATPTPTPSPSATPSPSPSPSATPSPTPSPSPSPSPTPVVTPTPTPSPTPSATPSPTPSATPSPTPSATPSPTPSPTPSATPSPSPSPTCVPGGGGSQVVPPAYTGTPGTTSFLGPLVTTPRTYQLLINANQLTGLVGTQINALTWRNPTSATVAWPAADVSFANYDIRLSESVAPAMRSFTFAANVVGAQTQVRSGALTIPAGSYTFGSSPNAFGPDITFNTPYAYNGGHLLIEIRHDGFTGTSRSVDAIGTAIAGYGTDFSAAWTGNYTGVTGVQGNFSIPRLTAGNPCPSPSPTPTPTPPAGSITFAADIYTEDETDVATITISRPGGGGPAMVTVTPSNGTAMGGAACTSGIDFVNTAQTASFAMGDTSSSVNIQTCGDGINEGFETVNLLLSGAGTFAPEVDNAILRINDTANTFRNPMPICTLINSGADLYPSPLTVANQPTSIGSMRVTLYDFFHQLPDNADVLLVSPGGIEFVIMGDAGGAAPIDVSAPVTLTFSDSATAVLPDSGPLVTGLFEPTTWEAAQANFPAPAPAGPYNQPGSTIGGTGLQTLNGTFGGTDPNGVWQLFVRDDAGNLVAVTGCFNGGWGLEFVSPTAAGATVSGRVLTHDGVAIRNAQMVLTGNSLTEPRRVTTGTFGYYSFDDLEVGETYVLTVNSKRFTFQVPSRVISLVDNVTDADFIADNPGLEQ